MAFAHVQGAHNSTGGGSATSIAATGSAIGSGNCVVGTVFWGNSATTLNSVSDGTNTYTVKDSTTATDGVGSASFIRGNITGGPTTITATFSASTQFLTIIWDEYSGGLSATDPSDGHAFQSQTAVTAQSSGNITTTVNGDLIWGGCWDLNGGSTISAAGGATLRTTDSAGAPGATEDKVQGTAGSVSSTFTSSAADDYTTYVIAVKPAAGAAAPFSQDDWPNPYRTIWYREWEENTRLPTPTVLPLPLHVQRDWPNPYPVYWYRSWEKLAATLPIATVLPTPLRKQVTGPNPQPVTWYQSWTQSSILSVPAPFIQSDWPLPKTLTWYQSWTEVGNSQLPFPTPFLPQDQSLPPRSYPRLSDYFWSNSLNVLFQEETFPFNQDDYPNPQRIIWYKSWEVSGNSLTAVTQAPFIQNDWPNPRPVTWYQDWNQNLVLNFPAVTVFPPFWWDYPNPPRVTWYQSLEGPGIRTVPGTPFVQSDWPLPRTYTPIPQSWIEFGNVQLPFPTPFFQNVDANTPVIVRPIDQTWIQSLVNFYQANTFPFSQKDYPNPYPVRWYVDYNQNLVIYLPAGIKPFLQSDWPVPRGNVPIDQYWYQSLAALFPPPPPVPPVTTAGRSYTESELKEYWTKRFVEHTKQKHLLTFSEMGKMGGRPRKYT